MISIFHEPAPRIDPPRWLAPVELQEARSLAQSCRFVLDLSTRCGDAETVSYWRRSAELWTLRADWLEQHPPRSHRTWEAYRARAYRRDRRKRAVAAVYATYQQGRQ